MARSSIRFWFALIVAVIAASFTDPLLEFASNRGLFGPGRFTDHSTIDVVPAALIGSVLLAGYVAIKARAMLLDLRAPDRALDGRISGLLPLAFALQMGVLYAMETIEQIIVTGHTLGATVWLGAPPAISLVVHAIVCAIVGVILARCVRSLADAAVAAIRLVRALTSRPVQPSGPIALRERGLIVINRFGPSLGRIGERAPPLL